MSMNDNTLLGVIIVLLAMAIAILALASSRRRARRRSDALRRQFGPEYERAVETLGSRQRAERELALRALRVQNFRVKELSVADRVRFESTWSRIQSQFVDDPAVAVAAASQLISEVMRARGYPVEDFEQRVADLSVEHSTVVQHYRAARALSSSTRTSALETEDLRQAVVHYRVLFAHLLQDSASTTSVLREAHG